MAVVSFKTEFDTYNMKVLSCIKPHYFKYSNKAKPPICPGYAIIKVKRVGVCGTDLHAFEGTQPYFSYPRILGHEFSGEFVSVEGDSDFNIGAAVTCIPYFYCGHCIACRNGKTNACVHLNVCGVHIDGAMCEYISVPAYSIVEGSGLDLDALALIEPLAIGAHGVRRASIREDEFVLVIGAGPIGLGTIEFAKIAGAKVIVLDVNDNRLAFCKEKLGITHVINPNSDNVKELLKAFTNGDMPTVVIDATGNISAINSAFEYLAHGGRYVLIGLQKDNILISHPEFHKREATLMSSRNATRQDFCHVIDAIKASKVNPTTYITHRAAFDEVKDQFASWLKPENGVIKAMISIG